MHKLPPKNITDFLLPASLWTKDFGGTGRKFLCHTEIDRILHLTQLHIFAFLLFTELFFLQPTIITAHYNIQLKVAGTEHTLRQTVTWTEI